MPELIPFLYHHHAVRTMQHDDGSTWWVAADVCAVLSLTNPSKVCERLKTSERTTITLSESGGPPHEILLINEPGLYRLIMRSRKKEAETFQDWVLHEVLPQIRKTGSYGKTDLPTVHNPTIQIIIDMALQLDRTEQLAIAAKAEAAQANANAVRALESQLFFTVAEYVYVSKLRHQVPESAYKAASDHLRLYCLDKRIPFRTIPVGGKRWEEEYGYHISVYDEAFIPWLKRSQAQATLQVRNIRAPSEAFSEERRTDGKR